MNRKWRNLWNFDYCENDSWIFQYPCFRYVWKKNRFRKEYVKKIIIFQIFIFIWTFSFLNTFEGISVGFSIFFEHRVKILRKSLNTHSEYKFSLEPREKEIIVENLKNMLLSNSELKSAKYFSLIWTKIFIFSFLTAIICWLHRLHVEKECLNYRKNFES